MTLKKKKYKSYDTLQLAFEASPICMPLYLILSIIQSIIQTAVTALATANFVDTAVSILNNMRPYKGTYEKWSHADWRNCRFFWNFQKGNAFI